MEQYSVAGKNRAKEAGVGANGCLSIVVCSVQVGVQMI